MTNQTRLVHLRDNVGYINSLEIPPDTGCNFLCLSDRQTFILRAFTFPYAFWETRTVQPGGGAAYWTDPVMLAEMQETLEDLELQLSGGGVMGCESIAAALVALAEAIEAQTLAGGSGCVTNVSCGTGALGALGGALANLTPEEIIGGEQEEAPVPGTPPEGFDTWAEYEVYKCQAAHYVWGVLRSACNMSLGFAGYAVTASAAASAVALLTDLFLFTVAANAIVAIVAAVIAFSALGVLAWTAFSQVGDYLDTNKDDIVCELYNSGTGIEAVSVMQTVIENAVQAVVWSGVLSGLGVTGVPLMVDFLAALATPDTVRPLFKLVVGLSVAGADCTACGGGDLLHNPSFVVDLSYWDHDTHSVWTPLESLQMVDNGVNTNEASQTFTVSTAGTYTVVADIDRHTGFAGHIWLQVDSTTVLDWSTAAEGELDDTIYLDVGLHTVYLQADHVVGAVGQCDWFYVSIPPLP